jgi:Ni,Fe-hydrogenase I cytochrome b subunit
VSWELWRRRVPLGGDLWLLTAVPGFGLVRLGHWASGLALTALVAGAFYLASSDSPDSTQFADYGRFGTVPPAYPRAAGWVLLAVTLALIVVGVALTLRRWLKLQSELDRR